MGRERRDGLFRLLHPGADGAPAVTVDVGDVQGVGSGQFHGLEEPLDIGALRETTGMEGDVGVARIRQLDGPGRGLGGERIVPAEQLEADGPLAQASVEECLELRRARIGALHRLAGSDRLDAGDVQADPVVAGDVQDAVDGSRHVQGGRHADLGHHLVARPPPQPGRGVHVHVDDAGKRDQAAEIEDLARQGGIQVRGNLNDLPTGNGEVGGFDAGRERIDDRPALQQDVKGHCHPTSFPQGSRVSLGRLGRS